MPLQDAVARVEHAPATDHDLVGIERRVEAVRPVQFRLCGVLRDLPAHAAFGTDMSMVEPLDRAPVAIARNVAAAEGRHRSPAVATRTRRPESDPSQLQR